MCSSIGVDPLASNKGFWAQALGVGDFYYQLAVQIIEVCLVTRAENGGLIAVAELLRRLRLLRGRRAALNRSQQASTHARSSGSAGGPDTSAIAASDIYTAVDKVKILGNGFRVVQVAGAPMLLSVPTELSTDTVAVMSHARAGGGRVSAPGAARALGWETARAVRALDGLLREGMGWLDAQDAEQAHWLPSVWQANQHAAEAAEADAADAAAAAAAGAPE
jgi:ESCRT-II complex subunit VPS22